MKIPSTIYGAFFLACLLGPYIIMSEPKPQPPSGCAGLTPIPLSSAKRSPEHQLCFDTLASYSCGGPEGSWTEIESGIIQCRTKHSRPVGKPVAILSK